MENNTSYEFEELMPVLTWLTNKYTGNDSTSVTYERANQIMEAALYCIEACENDSTGVPASAPQKPASTPQKPAACQKLSARAAYDRGYQLILQEVRDTMERYNEEITRFDSYGNRAYEDTIIKGMPLFFKRYDVRFAPQEHLLTLDYPVRCLHAELCGIHMIRDYLEQIWEEQEFLRSFPRKQVITILDNYHGDYRGLFFNLAEVVEKFEKN